MRFIRSVWVRLSDAVSTKALIPLSCILNRHCVIFQTQLEQFSVDVGIPVNCMFPVKNYHDEIDPDSDVDSLILSSLRNIINFADDHIRFKKSSERLISFNTS